MNLDLKVRDQEGCAEFGKVSIQGAFHKSLVAQVKEYQLIRVAKWYLIADVI